LLASGCCEAVNYITDGGGIGGTGTITSNNGKYTVKVADRSLSVYRSNGTIAKIVASGGFNATMQSDGNLVFINGPGAVMWTSGTANGYRNLLVIQDDGNLIIQLPVPFVFTIIWQTGPDNGSYTAFEMAQPPGAPPSTIPSPNFSNTTFTVTGPTF
jgi:hypothetical protein